MKKYFGLITVVILALCLFSGCSKAPAAAGGIDGTPEEIIAKIYAAHKQIDLPLVGQDIDLTDADAVAYFTGLSSADKLQAVSVSETMLGQPYSLVVARMKNAADAAKTAKDMLDKIDTRKWICVSADSKTAAYSGDVVMFFMVSSDFAEDATPESMAQAFKTACGGNAEILN